MNFISNIKLYTWWIVQIIVFPNLASDFIDSTIEIAMNESRPDVGSSRNKFYQYNNYISFNLWLFTAKQNLGISNDLKRKHIIDTSPIKILF